MKPDAVILCGGMGTRLQPILPDRPKGLAPILGRPFMDILIDELIRQGFRRAVLCVGYMRELIIRQYQRREGIEIAFSEETKQLGTGGAIKNALGQISTETFIVLNGDSFCEVNLNAVAQFHCNRKASATVVLSPSDSNRSDAGVVSLGEYERIESFEEKKVSSAKPYINAGIYVFRKRLWTQVQADTFSLERDYLPLLINEKNVFGYTVYNPVCDIGTPERYRRYSNSLPILRR